MWKPLVTQDRLNYLQGRLDGLTYQQIADKYGVSRQAVNQAIRDFRLIGDPTDSVYPVIEDYMKANKVSMSAMAAMCGVSAPTLNAYLQGKRQPKVNFIIKCCEVIGLPVQDVFGGNADEYDE